MDAVADVQLWPSEKRFSLPAEDTPSMLFRFGGKDGVLLGARAADPNGIGFAPGSDHNSVRLHFWAEDVAREVVAAGVVFDVWYGDDIGSGEITALD